MRISKIFSLGKSQAELDFVDIDVKRDTPLFLDPFFLSLRSDRWSAECSITLQSYFQKVIDLIRNGKNLEARRLFNYLHEDNSTCLGMSNGKPTGKGVGNGDGNKIFRSLLKSKAIQTGLIQDIEDNILFVENFGKDKLSDMTTNIIKGHLLEYTISQCDLHNIPLQKNVPTGYYWSRKDKKWIVGYSQGLIINGRQVILVPKGIVSFSEAYTPERYYRHFILNFLQNENINISSALVKERKDGKKYVTKKDLINEFPYGKEFIRKFTVDHPDVLEKFKAESNVESLKNIEIADISIKRLCKTLGEKLLSIPPGSQNASEYHNLICGILELLFYPDLVHPFKEKELHSGRKRIDLSFDNAAKSGIFFRFSNNFRLASQYVYVECKNYSNDPVNPELDQLAGRFSVNRGVVGFLLCRTIKNRGLLIQRCVDTFKDNRGLIIPLQDQDLINLMDNFNENNRSFIDTYLSKLVREITHG